MPLVTLFGWRLTRASAPQSDDRTPAQVFTRLDDLERSVRQLELERADLARVVTEGTEKWLRYLKRVQEITRRGEGDQGDEGDVYAELMRRKFSKGA